MPELGSLSDHLFKINGLSCSSGLSDCIHQTQHTACLRNLDQEFLFTVPCPDIVLEVISVVRVDLGKFFREDLAFRRRSEGSCRACSRHGALAADILEQSGGPDDLALGTEAVNIRASLVAADEPVTLEPLVMHLVMIWK